MSHAKLDAGIKADDEQVEVSSIQRRKALSSREANENPFFQRTVPPRLRYERDSDATHGLDGLLRHRVTRSIPQVGTLGRKMGSRYSRTSPLNCQGRVSAQACVWRVFTQADEMMGAS